MGDLGFFLGAPGGGFLGVVAGGGDVFEVPVVLVDVGEVERLADGEGLLRVALGFVEVAEEPMEDAELVEGALLYFVLAADRVHDQRTPLGIEQEPVRAGDR